MSDWNPQLIEDSVVCFFCQEEVVTGLGCVHWKSCEKSPLRQALSAVALLTEEQITLLERNEVLLATPFHKGGFGDIAHETVYIPTLEKAAPQLIALARAVRELLKLPAPMEVVGG